MPVPGSTHSSLCERRASRRTTHYDTMPTDSTPIHDLGFDIDPETYACSRCDQRFISERAQRPRTDVSGEPRPTRKHGLAWRHSRMMELGGARLDHIPERFGGGQGLSMTSTHFQNTTGRPIRLDEVDERNELAVGVVDRRFGRWIVEISPDAARCETCATTECEHVKQVETALAEHDLDREGGVGASHALPLPTGTTGDAPSTRARLQSTVAIAAGHTATSSSTPTTSSTSVRGGSHALSNLITLCDACHVATYNAGCKRQPTSTSGTSSDRPRSKSYSRQYQLLVLYT